MKTKKVVKIKSIMIIGKRWFDKINGNTYCSSRVFINGKFSFAVPYEYGYENYYEQAARDELVKRGILNLEKYSNGMYEGLRNYCDTHKIAFESTVTDGLKRDMVSWGEG